MKKLLSIMLAAAIVAAAGIAMSACGSDNGAGGNNTSASASADATKTIKSKEDLAGARIGVQLGTTGDIYVSDPENVKDAKIERFSKGADAVLALTQKKVDAVVIDNEPAKKFVAQNPGTKILDEPFENEDYAICLKQGSNLTEEFNKALKELKDDGTVQKIIDKYIKAS